MGQKMQVWSRSSKKEEKRKRICLENLLNYLFTQNISDDILAKIAEVQLDLNLEADKEELYWEQRARVIWLKNGDRNTSLFHKMTGHRKVRNKIAALEDEFDNRFSANEDMIKVATGYSEKLFSASEAGFDEHIFGLVEKIVIACMNESLTKQFSEEDICNAVKSMPPLKAPGVDGFVATFFQRYWHIVGPSISGYCLDILNEQKEIGDINKTRIVLIPKIDNPKNMSYFQPISLCNVIYKIIPKVLVNRMSDILGDCINEAQGAFIPGKLISDNVLIACEVLHSLKMKKNGRRGNFALKLDMSKAYDRVEWDFLAGMMKSLGFHNDWMVLIMRCITSVSYSVSLNGMCSDWFSPSRGLRQGDPLSPYLFLLCAEGFSTLLEDAKQKGRMRGASGVCTVRYIIREYEMSAGQKVNYDKSLIYFGANVKEEVNEDIIRVLGVRVASSPEKYLGLPMMVGRRKAWAFANFKDKFRKRVDGWSLRSMVALDFKFLFLFNKALLAKQVWRILTQPQCLLARVLKARYFPFTDILAAKIGSYPSFTRRSNCSARELIEDGMLWRIGKGDRVNIWNDPWLPGRENDILSGQEIRIRWITVNQLIRNLFDEDTASRILSIPISGSSLEDTLVWKFEGSGTYSVRSGYQRKLAVDTTCPLCKEDVESLDHLLWTCGILRRVWAYFQIHIQFLDESDQWKAPKAGVVKINFDASFLSKDRIAITAIIARNSTGSILGAETYLFENIANPFVAEARDCERALLFAKAMGFQRLAVEGDALSVIKSIKKMGKENRLLWGLDPWVTSIGGFDCEEGRVADEFGGLRGGFLALFFGEGSLNPQVWFDDEQSFCRIYGKRRFG
ncbi:reverse transcriptase [Gossypium australe]|uniref:Reverse transcriptase n=1 Tax=Gossypium australe TaxID=47621 RepID=A0A5B6VI10_9ROSI|nr:reverse transcriptase [Gossypium australe]